jgi:hypothetical protein
MQRMGEVARATLGRECRGRGMEALTGSGCRRDLPLLPFAGRRQSIGRARCGGGQRRGRQGNRTRRARFSGEGAGAARARWMRFSGESDAAAKVFDAQWAR